MKKREIYAGILHETYEDDNGKEHSCVSKVVGYREGDKFKCVDVISFDAWELSVEDFENRVSEVKQIF